MNGAITCTKKNYLKRSEAFWKLSAAILLGNLELSGLDDSSVAFPQLINIHAAIILIQIYDSSRRNIFLFVDYLAQKIINLDVITLLINFLQIESDERSGRVRIKFHDSVSSILRESS